MKVVIHMTKREELKGLPLLLRHSPGMVLPNRTYILDVDAAPCLRKAGVKFTELCRESDPPVKESMLVGKKI